MKTLFASVAVLCLISVARCQEDSCEITEADRTCIAEQFLEFSNMGPDDGTFNATCGQVDFPAVDGGNVSLNYIARAFSLSNKLPNSTKISTCQIKHNR